LILGMRKLSYDEKLSKSGRYSLAFRRMRGDDIEAFMILKGFDRVDTERLFPLTGEPRN